MTEAEIGTLQLGQVIYASGRGRDKTFKELDPWWPGRVHLIANEVLVVDFRDLTGINPVVGCDTVLFEHAHLTPQPTKAA